MAISLLCFLQGLDNPFPVLIDERKIKTIKDLKDFIKISKRQSILDNNIAVDKFEIWKVSIPLDDIASIGELRNTLAEIENGVKLDDQEILSLFEKISNHIQVFIGNHTNPAKDQVDEEKILLQCQSTLVE
ncbi:hypothetical protein RclHR1_00710002 [Rhizophagus clarus]|uniref:Crinkler effector protein N-terminal domain-containing protein n=1 Tax=Rhizophagus clarus TaxID=94130 RepID=A0A2Z6RX05_9GLOM|nr:hypothetical protein RclHR1_00710002 [Rhizophagus clarus]GES95854.1 hypothetical protein GLOIN_2v1695656 [Rhizophagus clarus]